MNQYVGLLELICSSSSMPTAEVLQDVSILYARLGQYIKIGDLSCVSYSFCYSVRLSAAHHVSAQQLLLSCLRSLAASVIISLTEHISFNTLMSEISF